MMQMDFFVSEKFSELENQTKKTFDRAENVRRGLFARHNRIEKKVTEIEEKQIKFEDELCRLKEMLLYKEKEDNVFKLAG